MTTAQKIIKYLALAFAFFIIISVISGIVFGLGAFTFITGISKEESYKVEIIEEVLTIADKETLEELDIDIKFSNLKIKTGENFKIETNNKYIDCKQKNGRIKIKDNSSRLVCK